MLAAGEGSFLYLLGEAIRRYQTMGSAPLRVLTRDRDGALEAVRSGEAHLAVTALDEVPAELVARNVAKVGTMVVMPKGHPLTRRSRLSVSDVAGEPLVLPHEGRPLRAALAAAFAAAGAKLTPAVEATGWELMLHFTRLGLGLAVVIDFCTLPAGMVGMPLGGLHPVTYRAVHRRAWRPGEPARRLLGLLAS